MPVVKSCVRPKRPLMLHQQDYINWAKSKQYIPCLMEMRLGKTLANIRLIQGIAKDPKKTYPILIVCPASVIEAWEKELLLEKEQYTVLHGKPLQKRIEFAVDAFNPFNKGRNWILINYESLLATPGLSLLEWFFVGLDESTVIKNPKAKISKLCCRRFVDAKYRAILSGLPSPEGELDLFQQFYFTNREFMGCKNYYEYRNKYFYIAWNGWQPKAGAKKAIQDYVHTRSFVLTRKDAGIGSKKIREIRTVKMGVEQRKVYTSVEKNFVGLLFNDKTEIDEDYEDNGTEETLETDHVITQRIWLARIAGGCDVKGNYQWNAKTTELLYLLRNDLYNENVVVWFRFDSEIRANSIALRNAGIKHETLTGNDSRLTKKKKQEWFRSSSLREKERGKVILCQQQKVAEHGVDMSSASTAIYYSYVYSGQTVAQTEDRIVSPLKKEPLLYIYLVTENSIDVDVVDIIRNKVRDARMFMRKLNSNLLKRIETRYGKNKG